MRSPWPATGRARRLGALAAVLLCAAAGLSACGGGGESDADRASDAATQAASTFAAGLVRSDLSDVDFTASTATDAQHDYAKVVAGMDGLRPQVSVGAVRVRGSAATAVLTWTWPLSDPRKWTYDVEVPLALDDGAWRVAWSHQDVESSLSAGSVLDRTSIEADRGRVLGAGGTPLVTQRSVVNVGIDRTEVAPAAAAASARTLARLTGIDAKDYVAQVDAAGPKAFVEAITYRLGQVPDAVQQAPSSVKGVALLNAHAPLAPTKEFAAPILGSVGPATAELIKAHPDDYAAGDEVGLSGLQARYDATLRGTPGVVVHAVASDGRERVLERVPATAGTPLKLTLDKALELRAESLLAHVGPASAIVAIRPSTGAVLAAANGPGNDGQDLATYGRYPPGSTFKTATSLALLRSGLRPTSTVPCTSSITVDGRSFTNDSEFPPSSIGRISLSQALAQSCNTAFISQRGRVGGDDLATAAATLGMGVDHEVGFPAYFGAVTAPTTQTGAAADVIGQGTVLASPMTMATVMASIERGSTVVPRLVTGIPGLDTDVPGDVRALSAGEDAALKSMMRDVVTTGTGRALLDVPGAPVIAKTGTAEFDAGPAGIQTHAWMIAAQGDLAVAVFVDRGHTGAGTAGPILEAFLRAARN